MGKRFFHKNLVFIITIDTILLSIALYLAHLIRFDLNLVSHEWSLLKHLLPFVLLSKVIIFYYFDLYRGMWRYTSIADLINIIKATTISSLIIISIILFSTRFVGFARSIFIIDWCLTILFISGYRLCIRLYFAHDIKDKPLVSIFKILFRALSKRKIGAKNLIIIGAGACGELISREIDNNCRLSYNIVGFLDDNQNKIGRKIHGIPILGNISEIQNAINKFNIDEALIAIPSATSLQMRHIVDHCKNSGVSFKTIPSYGELINGEVTVNAIRDIAYRDLIGREIINLNEEEIGDYIERKTVLITGAGGSIGSELCRQICRFRPERIVLYERAETPLYEIELELKRHFSEINIITRLADICNIKQLENVFEELKPNVVFHAAAYKHVPMLELQPWKAIENNILGTLNVVEASKKNNVDRFVFVSTDKAVRPVNIMGASKRLSEMLVQNQNGYDRLNTRFMIVRFGNVVGSSGSVAPLFKKQIENGGPVTVTHPNITRYFMTIPEACQLILQAGSMGKGGEIFLLDMGTPIKIDDMARDLIRLSGLEPDVDIIIEYIGLRPGEKLYEELITSGEGILPTDHKKIMILKGIDYNLKLLNDHILELILMAEEQNLEKIKDKLCEIVPDYCPS